MKAFAVTPTGPAIVERETPRASGTDVLVRVHACGLNRMDIAMSRGVMQGSVGGFGQVLGVEWAGEVLEAGNEASTWQPGDRVMCSGTGAYAEYALVDGGRLLPVPAGMSYVEAAALPVALQTMHDAIATNGKLQFGQTVLVQGASSGVGLMGMQVARVLGARWVAGSSTNEKRRAQLGDFGADLAFDSSDANWVEQVLAETGGVGVDLVVDQVAGPIMNQNLRATRVQGRIVNVGRLGGMHGDFDFDLHALRRIVYVGVTFRTRSRTEVREIVRRVHQDLWKPLQAGVLHMPIDRVYPFEELADALEYMGTNQHFGKIVVKMPLP